MISFKGSPQTELSQDREGPGITFSQIERVRSSESGCVGKGGKGFETGSRAGSVGKASAV